MAATPEEFFGFHHRQIKTVHFRMQGAGKGVWLLTQRARDRRTCPALPA
jgi:hypothetical protein